MWNVEDLEMISVELDFSSSGLGRCAATAIESAGVRLFNAIELVDMGSHTTQVEVCECCGCSGCASGGWVSFRRIGGSVAWVPAWNEMEKGAWERNEYAPPSSLRRNGAPVFNAECWERLRELHKLLPAAHQLPMVNSRETVRLCQWSAPGHVLGEQFTEPRLRRDLLLAVTDGDLALEADSIDQLLKSHFEATDPMELVPIEAPKTPIEFWLDLDTTPSWRAFARSKGQLYFQMNETLTLVPEPRKSTSPGPSQQAGHQS